MIIKEAFINYLLDLKVYRQYCDDNSKCSDFINKIEDEYIKAFNANPFEVEDIGSLIESIRTNLQDKESSFSIFNQRTGSGVPHAILNKHLITF